MTNAAEIDPDHLDFDPDALRAKYRAERDRRLRPEGNDQYRRIEGSLAPTPKTPTATSRPERPGRTLRKSSSSAAALEASSPRRA